MDSSVTWKFMVLVLLMNLLNSSKLGLLPMILQMIVRVSWSSIFIPNSSPSILIASTELAENSIRGLELEGS